MEHPSESKVSMVYIVDMKMYCELDVARRCVVIPEDYFSDLKVPLSIPFWFVVIMVGIRATLVRSGNNYFPLYASKNTTARPALGYWHFSVIGLEHSLTNLIRSEAEQLFKAIHRNYPAFLPTLQHYITDA